MNLSEALGRLMNAVLEKGEEAVVVLDRSDYRHRSLEANLRRIVENAKKALERIEKIPQE